MSATEYLILSSHYQENITIDLEKVGQKAKGLFNCPTYSTPPFFILTSALYKKWIENKTEAKILLERLLDTLNQQFALSQNIFIVRSSAKYESLEERGFYNSSKGDIHWQNLISIIDDIWGQNLSNLEKYSDNQFAIIIQQYIKPKLAGHLSNERRISRSKTDWLIEIVNDANEFVENIKFSTKPLKTTFSEKNFSAKRKQDAIHTLKLIGYENVLNDKRAHIEWVWDGAKIWIVQNDVEHYFDKGTKPGAQWKKSNRLIEQIELVSFNNFRTAKQNWKKINCVKTFDDCGLPYGNIYILEDVMILEQLLNDSLPQQLIKDLEWLLTYPIVIRMDIAADNNILLPRTETITTIDNAVVFLKAQTKNFTEQGLKINDFCFLIHRFINAQSCALAFSKPNLSKARIDSTWGIVDGLYYHPHDSFEVNLSSDSSKVKKLIRCKTEYLDTDVMGKWISKKSGTDWDWAESLTNKQVLQLAEYNTKLADYLNSQVTVMYFVDVDTITGYPKILPWFYTKEETTDTSERFTDIIFSEKRELIQSENDFIKFKEKWALNPIDKVILKLKFNPDILRDKELIEEIGKFSKEENIPIELEGSILSHTYYILQKQKARVKCKNPFEPVYTKKKFFKLVRDKIPVNIASKGEKVKTVKVNSGDLLRFIKQKAVEEAYEFFWETENDAIIQEIADIYEVIRTACKIFGIHINELESIANKKSEKKGGFESGIILLDTEESSLIDIVDHSGESLLINDKNSISRTKFIRSRKVSFGIDDSITLPYLLPNNKSNLIELKTPSEFQNTNSIQVIYTSQGIKLKFIKPKLPESLIQISLFPNDS